MRVRLSLFAWPQPLCAAQRVRSFDLVRGPMPGASCNSYNIRFRAGRSASCRESSYQGLHPTPGTQRRCVGLVRPAPLPTETRSFAVCRVEREDHRCGLPKTVGDDLRPIAKDVGGGPRALRTLPQQSPASVLNLDGSDFSCYERCAFHTCSAFNLLHIPSSVAYSRECINQQFARQLES